MRLSVGVWKTMDQFNRWLSVHQYEGTEMWTTPAPLLHGDGEMVTACDIEVEAPLTFHVDIKDDRPSYDTENLGEFERTFPAHDEDCCVLCRVSGHVAAEGRKKVSNKVMFVMARDGRRIHAYGRMIPGVWMPCICQRLEAAG